MILVTGPTGNVGREVVKELLEAGQNIRAAVFNDAEARHLPPEIDLVLFDFTDPATYQPALEGVAKIFLMRPPQLTDMGRTLNPFIDQAKESAVKQIVFISLLGVEDNPQVPHYVVEQHLKRSGVPFTLLRPSFFMQNFSTTHQQEIREQSQIFVPVGRARTSFVDARDIGAAAARVLIEGGHSERAYALTGGEALDYYQVADIFSRVLGRDIVYRNPSIPAFLWFTWRRGVPLQFALVMAFLYRATRSGAAEVVTADVHDLIGRPPITMRQFVEKFAPVWKN